MRQGVALLVAAAVCCGAFVQVCSARAAPAATKPHILFIVADDLGFHDLGFRGTRIMTPTLDSLAKDGVKLDQYYVQPVCSPSRASIMTGRYPIRYGLQHYVILDGEDYGLDLNETLLPEVLGAAGYRCHAVGKWHLGMNTWNHTPTFRGFETFHGYYTGGEDYYTHVTEGGYDFRLDVRARCGPNCSKVDWANRGNYSTHVFTKSAIDVVNAHDPSEPLFLYLPYQAVHSPDEVPAYYSDKYNGIYTGKRKTFAGMLTAMDEGIGNVTAALKARGMWDNTLVIFTADNGGPIEGSSRCHVCGDATGSSNYPLRGGKHSLWEGGVRGTAFVHGKGLDPAVAGTEYRGLMHVTDWLQTVAHAAGALPQLRQMGKLKLDGFDLYEGVTSAAASPRTQVLLNYDRLHNPAGAKVPDGPGNGAIRIGDLKLLLGDPGPPDIYSPADDVSEVPLGPLAAAAVATSTNVTVQLYNVTADPSERHDLSSERPEDTARLLAALRQLASEAVAPHFCFPSQGTKEHPCIDPNSSPAKHDGAWTPWQG